MTHQPSAAADAGNPYAVLRAWEKLRLLYNAILIPWSILVAAVFADAQSMWLPLGLIGCGLLVKVCFCVGPVAELYCVWLGLPAVPVRWVLFGTGTLFTMVGAGFTLSPVFQPVMIHPQ
jgi:hypothetical protein